MGQQNIDTINIFTGKTEHTEYPSELQCYDDNNELAKKCMDLIFNKQYGIFYYEPCSKKEAEQMIRKFEEHIEKLRKSFDLPKLRWDITFTDIKTGKEYCCDWNWVMFPSGETGYRLEYTDNEHMHTQEFGTLIVIDGKLEIVQW